MRWVASMVADVHRVLMRGGVYLYPDDARPGYSKGRLHLLYEANPVALLIEQAGGLAIDGVNRILDLELTKLHARTPLIFGATDKVEVARSYFIEGAPVGRAGSAVRPPWPVARILRRGRHVHQTSHHRDNGIVGRGHDVRESARSIRYSAARRSTPSTSKATPSINGTASKCARR